MAINQALEESPSSVEPFVLTLSRYGLRLERAHATTLQINVGLLCNQACKHCHLDAGPDRTELMDQETLDSVVDYARRARFHTIDITGGAPELHPDLTMMIEQLSPHAEQLMIRSNLTALETGDDRSLIDTFRRHGVEVVASLPSVNPVQTESQRGSGLFEQMIRGLQRLNAAGFGRKGTGLKLHLVSNPTGAFLSPSQAEAQERFRTLLMKKWGIVFDELFTFANVPLGRFRRWLHRSGNFEKYMERLSSGFNPCTVDSLMCRTLISVAWDGYLYDCDFNLAKGLPLSGQKTHVSEMEGPPMVGTTIAVADHCYTCAAGSGFT